MMSGADQPTVLVVEDENVVAMDIVVILEKLKYPVVGVAASGEEAVAMVAAKSPGLILMDINLRGSMDGICASQRILETLFVPIIYLTAYSDEATLVRAGITYPFGYILKPFEDRDIEVAIRMALFRHQMECSLRDGEKRLQAILASIGDAVIASDPNNRITFLNRAAETLLGWPSERAKGRLLSDVLKVVPRGGGALRLVLAGKDDVPIELVESTVTDASGAPTGHMTVARDVSERMRAQEAHDRELVERAARLAAEGEQTRARLLGEISLALGDIAELDEQKAALSRVADLIAQTLGTSCVIEVEDPRHAERADGPYDGALTRADTRELRARASDGSGAVETELPECHSALRELGEVQWLRVPLRARQRSVGTLRVAAIHEAHDERSYAAFLQQIGERIALAIDNARLFRAAQGARLVTERLYRAEQRSRAEAEALFRITAALSEAQHDLPALVQRVTDEGTALVGAKVGAFFSSAVEEARQGDALATPSRRLGESSESSEALRNTPLFRAVYAGQVVRLDDVRDHPTYAMNGLDLGGPTTDEPVASCLGVPVFARTGAVTGGFFFGHTEPGRFTGEHERLAQVLAAHAAVAIDNACLFDETRKAEERQAGLVKELERALRFSEMFVGILGHDLRNPLAGIIMAANLLSLQHGRDALVVQHSNRILSISGRMRRMIDQLLDFTHIRLGRGIPLQRKATDLTSVFRAVVDEILRECERVDVYFDVRGSAVGTWDADRLAQLVSNLAGNALQHRRPGTPVLMMIDGSRAAEVRIVVQNDGGIPPELLPVVFEPLRGREQRGSEGSSGLGLGLFISRQIVLAHGGRIGVESVAGRTRFTVELPRTPPADVEQVFDSRLSKDEFSRPRGPSAQAQRHS